MCKKPLAARLKTTQRCILQNGMLLCKIDFAKWRAVEGAAVCINLYDFDFVVVVVRCVRFLFPCTCDFSLLRFLNLSFVIFVSQSPRAARLKTTQRCILQNQLFSNKMILLNGVRLNGAPFLWSYMTFILSFVLFVVFDFCFRITISTCLKSRFSCTCVLSLLQFLDVVSLYLFAKVPGRLA